MTAMALAGYGSCQEIQERDHFHAVGHEYGVGGYIENINALVSVQSPLS